MPVGHTARDGIDPATLAPAVLAAQEAAERLGLEIGGDEMLAILGAASGYPDPRLFVAVGGPEVPSITPGSFEQRVFQLLTEFHGSGHDRIKYFVTLGWTESEVLWFTNGSPHDGPEGTRVVRLMGQLADAIAALGRQHEVLDAES